jgi:hypothetical protein
VQPKVIIICGAAQLPVRPEQVGTPGWLLLEGLLLHSCVGACRKTQVDLFCSHNASRSPHPLTAVSAAGGGDCPCCCKRFS